MQLCLLEVLLKREFVVFLMIGLMECCRVKSHEIPYLVEGTRILIWSGLKIRLSKGVIVDTASEKTTSLKVHVLKYE